VTTNSTNCVVRIQGLSSAGQGVARAEDGKVVFIEGALPDETCLIRRHYHKRTFDRGTLLEIVTPSPDRIEPRCPHYSECGGCQLQHLRYSEQLVFKHTRIREAFSRIAGFSDVPIRPVMPSPQWEYRNKLALTLEGTDKSSLMGMMKSASHETVEISDCLIASPAIRKVIRPLKQFQQKLTPFFEKIHIRLLGDSLVLVFDARRKLTNLDVAESAASKAAQGLGAQGFCINSLGSALDPPRIVSLHGPDSYRISYGNIYSHCGATSFLQVNPAIAARLYEAVDMIETSNRRLALDGYCGVGILTLMLAEKFESVIGLDSDRKAIRYAIQAAREQSVQNVSFYDEPLPRGLGKGQCDLASQSMVVLDPPRGGCDEETLHRITLSGTDTIAMISCHPATLARDLSRLDAFEIEEVLPFDMFPQTYHIESLVVLRRRNRST